MGARKNINVTVSPTTVTAISAVDVTGFRIYDALGTTPLSNYTHWTGGTDSVPVVKALGIGDSLSIAVDEIYGFLGTAGATVNGQFTDTKLIAALDVMLDGTEVIIFCTADKLNIAAAVLPYLDVSEVGTDWKDAIAF